jgi:hypothetical protein
VHLLKREHTTLFGMYRRSSETFIYYRVVRSGYLYLKAQLLLVPGIFCLSIVIPAMCLSKEVLTCEVWGFRIWHKLHLPPDLCVSVTAPLFPLRKSPVQIWARRPAVLYIPWFSVVVWSRWKNSRLIFSAVTSFHVLVSVPWLRHHSMLHEFNLPD